MPPERAHSNRILSSTSSTGAAPVSERSRAWIARDNAHSAIVAGGGDELSIGRPAHDVDGRGVSFVDAETLAGAGIPERDQHVLATSDEISPIGRPGQRVAIRWITVARATSCGIPDLVSDGKGRAIGRPGQIAGPCRQGREQTASGYLPDLCRVVPITQREAGGRQEPTDGPKRTNVL